jgi:hypothetical protein
VILIGFGRGRKSLVRSFGMVGIIMEENYGLEEA